MTKQSVTTRVARQILDAEIAKFEQYEADVTDWYANGDGRPVAEGGRGYSYPACVHGMSRWTDYDNICGPCEDGYGYFDWHREARRAIADAKWRLRVYGERADWLFSRPEDMPEELVEALRRWVVAPLDVRA